MPGFYGWTARIFYVGVIQYGDGQPLPPTNNLSVAAAESIPAHDADQLRAIIRHARIPREHAAEFWDRVFQLIHEFMQLPHRATPSGPETAKRGHVEVHMPPPHTAKT